jgi:transglutaminase superfamily protein
LARAKLVLFSFRRIAARLGEVSSPDLPSANPAADRLRTQPVAAARDIGWAVSCAARHVPFEAVCLPQAIAAKKMLARRGVKSVLHFGVARGEDSLDAHAWVDSDGVEVTGYPVAGRFREVARFLPTRFTSVQPAARCSSITR